MSKEVDDHVADFPSRSLTAAPYSFVAPNALMMKAPEGGRVVNVAVMIAAGVNGDGRREILGLKAASSEGVARWLAIFRDLAAKGLIGVKLVTSDAHAGLVAATAATLPGAAGTAAEPTTANLMAVTPISFWP